MNRRELLKSLVVGGVSLAAARTFPFRVYSFPNQIVPPEQEFLVDWGGIERYSFIRYLGESTNLGGGYEMTSIELPKHARSEWEVRRFIQASISDTKNDGIPESLGLMPFRLISIDKEKTARPWQLDKAWVDNYMKRG